MVACDNDNPNLRDRSKKSINLLQLAHQRLFMKKIAGDKQKIRLLSPASFDYLSECLPYLLSTLRRPRKSLIRFGSQVHIRHMYKFHVILRYVSLVIRAGCPALQLLKVMYRTSF